MSARKAAFVYHDSLTRVLLREDHPLRPIRLRHTYQLLQAYGAFDGRDSILVEPRPATREEIVTFHTDEYVRAVESLSQGEDKNNTSRYGFSQWGDNPMFPGMYEASLLSTGASVVAAELVASGRVGVAFNGAGGLHHAMAGNASGFCVFNDPVIAINHPLAKGKRVVYVDIDAHHGDGVQNAYYTTDQVLTISLHESGQFLFPGTGFVEEVGKDKGKGYSVNVPLAPYTGDDTYLWVFHQVVPPLVEAFKPDVVVSQLGIDSYHSDPLTHLMLTSKGYIELVKWFSGLSLPWVALGGGGYDIDAVARCWCLAYGVMCGKEWPDEVPEDYPHAPKGSRLRDESLPSLTPQLEQQVKSYAEQSVARVKELIFPLHGLR